MQWQNMLYYRYDKRIDRQEARTIKVNDVLGKFTDERTLKHWQQAFDKFKQGWNSARSHMDKDLYQTVLAQMNENVYFFFFFLFIL